MTEPLTTVALRRMILAKMPELDPIPDRAPTDARWSRRLPDGRYRVALQVFGLNLPGTGRTPAVYTIDVWPDSNTIDVRSITWGTRVAPPVILPTGERGSLEAVEWDSDAQGWDGRVLTDRGTLLRYGLDFVTPERAGSRLSASVHLDPEFAP